MAILEGGGGGGAAAAAAAAGSSPPTFMTMAETELLMKGLPSINRWDPDIIKARVRLAGGTEEEVDQALAEAAKPATKEEIESAYWTDDDDTDDEGGGSGAGAKQPTLNDFFIGNVEFDIKALEAALAAGGGGEFQRAAAAAEMIKKYES